MHDYALGSVALLVFTEGNEGLTRWRRGRVIFNHEWTLMAPSTDYALNWFLAGRQSCFTRGRGGLTHGWFLQKGTGGMNS